MTEVSVLFFASLRDEVGCDRVRVQAGCLSELWAALESKLGQIAIDTLKQNETRLAINHELVDDTLTELTFQPGDEIAFLPPVTGG